MRKTSMKTWRPIWIDFLPVFHVLRTGVEIRILERLFTPEEAALAQLLTLKPEAAQKHCGARRSRGATARPEAGGHGPQGTDLPPAEGWRGVLYGRTVRGGDLGISLNDLDPDLIKDVNEYLPHLFRGGKPASHAAAAHHSHCRRLDLRNRR